MFIIIIIYITLQVDTYIDLIDVPDNDLGHFINQAALDRNLDIFYSYANQR